MTTRSLGTAGRLRDPNYMPKPAKAVHLGIQHVLAMFAGNVVPAIVVAGAAGFGLGSNSPDFPSLVYLIQMSVFFAGVATLIQTIGMGPLGAKLPVVQGTSFLFLPIMIPVVAGRGVDAMAVLMGGVVIGGIFHFFLGAIIGKIRIALPPLVTGLVVLMIGLSLVKVGIQYAAGGVVAMNRGLPEFGSLQNWALAFAVIAVSLGLRFFARGLMSVSAVLIGMVAGYVVACFRGIVNFDNVAGAASFGLPIPVYFGFEFSLATVVGFALMGFICAVVTVGDVSGTTRGGARREASDREIAGAIYANGLGTAVAGVFGALPMASYHQNVRLVSMTGVMSRHVVAIGALFLIVAGLLPKVGAAIATVPVEVMGGGMIVMFGMVAAGGINMLRDVKWSRRNMIILAISLSIGLGLQLVPQALQHLPSMVKTPVIAGLLPAAIIAIVLNLVLPEDLD